MSTVSSFRRKPANYRLRSIDPRNAIPVVTDKVRLLGTLEYTAVRGTKSGATPITQHCRLGKCRSHFKVCFVNNLKCTRFMCILYFAVVYSLVQSGTDFVQIFVRCCTVRITILYIPARSSSLYASYILSYNLLRPRTQFRTPEYTIFYDAKRVVPLYVLANYAVRSSTPQLLILYTPVRRRS